MNFQLIDDVTLLTSIVDNYVMPAIKSIIDEKIRELTQELDLISKDVGKIKTKMEIFDQSQIEYFKNRLKEE